MSAFTPRRRITAEAILAETVAVLLTFVLGVLAFLGSGPVDYRFHGGMLGISVPVMIGMLTPIFLLRLFKRPRPTLVLTAEGIGTGDPYTMRFHAVRVFPDRIPWGQVVGVRTRWRPRGYHP